MSNRNPKDIDSDQSTTDAMCSYLPASVETGISFQAIADI